MNESPLYHHFNECHVSTFRHFYVCVTDQARFGCLGVLSIWYAFAGRV